MNDLSKVMEGLFIGSDIPTGDETLLRACKISFVLSIGQRPLRIVDGIKYKFFEADDVPGFPIMNIFHECKTTIDKEIKAGGTVFVHCKAGVSRSAAVVIAYLMEKENISYKQAFDKLKQVRWCVQPNEGFIRQLEEFENELKLTKT